MSYYECKNCSYTTKFFKDMKKHINKTTLCTETLNKYYIEYSLDHRIILTLLPHDNNGKQIIEKEELLPDYNYKILTNRRKLINRICDERDNNKKCYYCNESFEKIIELRKHILVKCFKLEMDYIDNQRIEEQKELNINNKNSPIINNNTTNINSNNTTNNITNNITNNNTTNNTTNNNTTNNNVIINNNIVLNIDKSLLSFNEDWDTSNINSNGEKLEILCSDILYTSLLNKLLTNDKNLNVILDKKSKYGFVYDGEAEKFVEMAANDIFKKTMKKLRNNLLKINNDIKNHKILGYHKEYEESTIEFEKKIRSKYVDYDEEKKKRDYVNCHLANIYDTFKNKTNINLIENKI